jgi:hypothetical protein
MFHDSHGAGHGSNSDLSVTAFKIEVDGELRVVGVGHHTGPASYKAIFPFSTDPAVRTFSASPDITHQL